MHMIDTNLPDGWLNTLNGASLATPGYYDPRTTFDVTARLEWPAPWDFSILDTQQ
jgi:hypothetical protein